MILSHSNIDARVSIPETEITNKVPPLFTPSLNLNDNGALSGSVFICRRANDHFVMHVRTADSRGAFPIGVGLTVPTCVCPSRNPNRNSPHGRPQHGYIDTGYLSYVCTYNKYTVTHERTLLRREAITVDIDPISDRSQILSPSAIDNSNRLGPIPIPVLKIDRWTVPENRPLRYVWGDKSFVSVGDGERMARVPDIIQRTFLFLICSKATLHKFSMKF